MRDNGLVNVTYNTFFPDGVLSLVEISPILLYNDKEGDIDINISKVLICQD